jgi:hypothetical protein
MTNSHQTPKWTTVQFAHNTTKDPNGVANGDPQAVGTQNTLIGVNGHWAAGEHPYPALRATLFSLPGLGLNRYAVAHSGETMLSLAATGRSWEATLAGHVTYRFAAPRDGQIADCPFSWVVVGTP